MRRQDAQVAEDSCTARGRAKAAHLGIPDLTLSAEDADEAGEGPGQQLLVCMQERTPDIKISLEKFFYIAPLLPLKKNKLRGFSEL